MRVLIVVHGFPPLALGGTEAYSHALAARLREAHGDELAILTREHVPEAPEYRVRDEYRDGLRIRWINNTFRDTRTFEDTYDNPTITRLAAEFLDTFRPQLAHVHHLTCLSTGVVFELKRRDIPVVLTLHDYWLLCHRGQLLDVNLRRCEGPLEHGCRGCMGPAGSAGPALYAGARMMRALEARLPKAVSQPLRRGAEHVASHLAADSGEPTRVRLEHMRRVLDCTDRVLAPSEHMRRHFLPLVGNGRIETHEYGVDCERFAAARTAVRSNRPLRLGFVGSLIVSKAPHLLLEAFRRLPQGTATVTIIGAHAAYHGDDGYRTQLEPLMKTPGVAFHGAATADAIPGLLAQLDLLVVPSIWEENSPFVIREAFAAGVPVMASRIGGIPETLADGAGGLLFEPGNVDHLSRLLARLVDEPDLLATLRATIPAVRTLEDDARSTRALYETLIEGRSARSTVQYAPLQRHERIAAVILNYRTPDDTLLTVRSVLASTRPFDDIIVVDNAADDALRASLRELLDRITVITTGSNLGFPGGVNVGIREARARGATHVMLVNSDVVLAPSALGTLLATLREHPVAGIAAPMVMRRARPDIIETAGMAFSEISGRMRHPESGIAFDRARLPAWKGVAGVSGCAMLIADSVFERIGLLPDQYFFSFEDLAFCLAARDAGFEVGVCGTALAYHEGSRSLGQRSARGLYFGARNQLLLSTVRPSRGPWHRVARAGAIVTFNLLHALRASPGSVGGRLAAVTRGTRDHLRGKYGPD